MTEPSRELCLSVAFADRVTSLLTIFFGRLDAPFNTDIPEVRQGVEARWIQLAGHELVWHPNTPLDKERERVRLSGLRGAGAAVAAIDVVAALAEENLSRIAGLALAVALEMDRAAAAPPPGSLSWAAFESRAQADLFDFTAGSGTVLTPAEVQDLRRESGAQSMAYRNGMKALLR